MGDDIEMAEDTNIVYAWRAGAAVSQHPNSQRGSAEVNFVDGTVAATCDDAHDYFALHGALLLVAWMVIAPYGIYQARCAFMVVKV